MGYLHIDNLYKNQEILLFKEGYALEKIHGTSANVKFDGNGTLIFFSGGEKHDKFKEIFDYNLLLSKFKELFNCEIIIFGEAYGGKCQGMSDTYGKSLKFVAFDVKVENNWIDVPNACDIVNKLGLEFVDYKKIPMELKYIDEERDLPSTQAIRNGCGDDKEREGIVLRPLIELIKNNGARIIAKHKGEKFRETLKTRKVSSDDLEIITNAKEIAKEWVTPMRLIHILDKMDVEIKIENTGKIITAMIEDIYREGKNEIEESPLAKREIGRLTAVLYKRHLNNLLNQKI